MIRPALGVVALTLATLPGATRADVFEVGADGAMVVRANAGGVIDAASDAEPAPDVPDTAVTVLDPPVAPAAFQASLASAAESARVSPTLLAALVWQESRWRPTAVSSKGARGLTQLMPGTARALAVDPRDDASNLAGGARYLRTMLDLFNGNIERALAAYNAGPARVMRAGGLPAIAETRAYVSSIIDRLGATGAGILTGVTP